jgi:hypothetical protein
MNLIRGARLLSALLVFQGFAHIAAEQSPTYLTQATITQTADVLHITANSPRPLLQTLDALRQKYGWVVDYEDPRYISHLDVIDVPGDSSHSRLPAGGNFSVEFPAAAPEQEKTLHLLVDSYNQSRNPGRFEMRRTSQGNFYVVGTSAYSENDSISPQRPLFDVPVSIPTRQRTIADAINLICHALAVQSHTAVTAGVSPRSLLAHTSVKIGGTKVSARELLLQCLSATERKLYWCLLYDPTSKGYVLNIHTARS